MALRIDKQVLGLDVPVAVAERVDVGEGAEALIGVEFDEEDGHWLLHLVVVFEHAIDRLGDVVHHDVKVDFVLLVALRVECVLESDYVRVLEFFHDLQFAIFVPLVLINLLDGHNFASFRPSCLKCQCNKFYEFS